MKKPVIRIRQHHRGHVIVEQKRDLISNIINFLFGIGDNGNWLYLQSFEGDDAFEDALAYAKRARNLITIYVED